MQRQSMAEAMATTVNEGLSRGLIDSKLHAAPIEALMLLAERADEGSGADNVTLPSILKYLAALGLTPEQPKPNNDRRSEQPKAGKLQSMRSGRSANLRAIG